MRQFLLKREGECAAGVEAGIVSAGHCPAGRVWSRNRERVTDMNWSGVYFAVVPMIAPALACAGSQPPSFERMPDVIYGHKHGLAMTMDVFRPKKQNGAGVIYVMSGGWYSAREMISEETCAVLVNRGYTVFAVVHGSQPRFTIPEAAADLHRAVRFIRANAAAYGVAPDRLGISGGSAGGHLSLLIATSGAKGNPAATDPVDRESSRVQAVACFFPPTDFLNYGKPGRDITQALEAELKPFHAPFDFVELDQASGRYVLITDQARRLAIAREVSPITHVSSDDPPALIVHGDADTLVPIQQSQVMVKALEAAGVPAKLAVKKGQGHGWENWPSDIASFADWFDTHLKARQ